ncbi:MAG: hypothetical protein AMXMBFR7_39180 [Planctomycetota bacterium]
MQIEYCELCNSRVTERDQELGHAAWISGSLLCKSCMEKRGLQAPPRTIPVNKKESGSGIHRVPGVGSGIHSIPQVPPKPGKVRPPSGLFGGNPGSNVRRGRQSKVRGGRSAVRAPGSGVKHVPPTSSIRAASGERSPSSSRLRNARRRSSGIMGAARAGNTLWVPVVGVLVGLVIGAGLFYFLIVR